MNTPDSLLRFERREACPVCAATRHSQQLSLPFSDPRVWRFLETWYSGRIKREALGDARYSILRCEDCDLLFQEFVLDSSGMHLLYNEWFSPENSLKKKREADIGLFESYGAEVAAIARLLKKKPAQIRVLEYGSGWGHWLAVAKAYGMNVTGVEYSTPKIDFALANGLRVLRGVEHEPDGSYDCIYANQVFEHLTDPQVVMRSLARLLSTNGLMCIKVPSSRGMGRRLRNPDWVARKDALHPLEHVNCYSRKALAALGAQFGLTTHSMQRFARDQWRLAIARPMKFLSDLYLGTEVFMLRE
jgi:2-polyprenyl-3-methyl-5-hydroxy-6-metoxy-1,4-benzoquinol methylase